MIPLYMPRIHVFNHGFQVVLDVGHPHFIKALCVAFRMHHSRIGSCGLHALIVAQPLIAKTRCGWQRGKASGNFRISVYGSVSKPLFGCWLKEPKEEANRFRGPIVRHHEKTTTSWFIRRTTRNGTPGNFDAPPSVLL